MSEIERCAVCLKDLFVWRNQPYPSENTTRLIYINPYIKGPDDKPIKVTETTYKVDR